MNLGEDILRLLYALSGYLAVDTCFLLQFFFLSILPQLVLFNSGYLLDSSVRVFREAEPMR